MAKKAGKEPEVPEEAPDEVEVSEPEAEVAEIVEVLAEPSVEEVLAGERDRYLRLLAEYENYRKRTAKERETLYSDAKAEMLAKLLPVYDNLARADQNKGGDE
ncbi:MAG: nucleotide exchange factor GrpE, partial [Oscillospiraceae bacterium]|nr:nucleotide exchange factor GrpE [Oscillospiraceae bacterium]